MNLAIRPVQSLKHIVDTNGGITGAGASVNDVINAVDAPVIATPNQIHQGSTVNAIFLRVDVIQKVAAGGVDNIYMIVYKNPGGNVPNPAVDGVGVSDKRKFVFHQEMAMLGTNLTPTDAIPRTLFKGVIKIPPRYKRFGFNDKLQVVIGHRVGEVTQQSEFCLQCIYKEYQ